MLGKTVAECVVFAAASLQQQESSHVGGGLLRVSILIPYKFAAPLSEAQWLHVVF